MMNRNRGTRVVAVAVGVLAILTLVPSNAFGALGVTLFHIRGTVTDALGRPLAGARVDDGNQSVLTAVDGTFDLPEENSGTYDITAQRADTLLSTVTVGATIPVDKDADFTLEYRLGISPSDFGISTEAGPATTTLAIRSWAPLPGLPGDSGGKSCVYVTDSRTAATSPATFSSTLADGSHEWAYSLTAPQSTMEDEYQLRAKAVDCADGTRLSHSNLAQYTVDNTAPILTSPFPTGWTSRPTTVGATLQDTGGTYVVQASITVDGISHAVAIADPIVDAQLIQITLPGLSDGLHSARIDATDAAGNDASPLSFTFSVDGLAPELSAPTPTSTVATSSPRIAISAFDSDSGINPASVVMTLSNGLVTNRVAATYDAADHTISYQLPTTLKGVGLGEFPLLDGTYTVHVTVQDIVGSSSTLSWSFVVHTLPTI